MSIANFGSLENILHGSILLAKEYVFQLGDYSSATWLQNFGASIIGASASLIVSAPLDVIKTRIQNKNFEHAESGFTILKNMARNEGEFRVSCL